MSLALLSSALLALATLAVRMVLWFGYLRHLLEPVLAFESLGSRSDDPLVLRADAALQTFAGNSALTFSVSWLVVQLFWVLFLAFDLPFHVPAGNSEILAGLLFSAAAPGLGPLSRMLFEALLVGLRSEVGMEVASRSLRPKRPAISR